MSDLASLSCIVIDDDTFMLNTLSIVLSQIGVGNVIQADNARDGLHHIVTQDTQLDVIISDLNMPDMDGIELLRHLSSLGSKANIILISGEDPRLLQSVQNLCEQYQLPVLGALAKPVSKNELIELLQNYQPCEQPPLTGPAAMIFADELQAAITNGQLSVHYQPQVAVDDMRLIGVEALARWRHPEKGPIPPDIFIGIAEKYDLIHQLTEFVLNTSLQQLDEWRGLGLDITMAVNFSALTLNQLELPEKLYERVSQHNIEPNNLTIEMTESSLPQDTSTTLDVMNRLRLKGFGLSIDDFGTGFSSLQQLQQIPFTELKIDRAFVHRADTNHARLAILESSIDLAKRLKIRCVAEGAEDQQDCDLVSRLGCDTIQGYHYAKPMPAEQLMEWIKTYRLADQALVQKAKP